MVRQGLRQAVGYLASVPGISAFSAAWLPTEIGPVARYPCTRAFLSFYGWCPHLVKSDTKVYSEHMDRRSNKYVRTIFYKVAMVVCDLLKDESVLKNYATRMIRTKRPKRCKLALMIVAAKIERIMFGILQNPTLFFPRTRPVES